jgi:hypothetical protein
MKAVIKMGVSPFWRLKTEKEEEEGKRFNGHFPQQLWLEVMSFLPLKEHQSMAPLNKMFNALSKHPYFWTSQKHLKMYQSPCLHKSHKKDAFILDRLWPLANCDHGFCQSRQGSCFECLGNHLIRHSLKMQPKVLTIFGHPFGSESQNVWKNLFKLENIEHVYFHDAWFGLSPFAILLKTQRACPNLVQITWIAHDKSIVKLDNQSIRSNLFDEWAQRRSEWRYGFRQFLPRLERIVFDFSKSSTCDDTAFIEICAYFSKRGLLNDRQDNLQAKTITLNFF